MSEFIIIGSLAGIAAELTALAVVQRRARRRRDDRFVSWRTVDRLNGRRD